MKKVEKKREEAEESLGSGKKGVESKKKVGRRRRKPVESKR
jgi:hypothetical protein